MRFSLIVLILAGVVAELLLRLFMTNQYLGDETYVQNLLLLLLLPLGQGQRNAGPHQGQQQALPVSVKESS